MDDFHYSTLVRDSISVLMPVRNGVAFIEEVFSFCETMLDDDDELIIVEDNSTDLTPKKLLETFGQLKNVRILKNPGVGLVDALNYGLAAARHSWVARMDIDDIYHVDRLNVQRSLISERAVAIFSDYSFIDSTGTSMGTIPSAIFHPFVYISLIASQRTPHPSVLFHKESVLKVGGYQKEDFPAEDVSLWFRLGEIGELISAPQVLLNYRLNGASISIVRRQEMILSLRRVLARTRMNPEIWNSALINLKFVMNEYNKFENSKIRKLLLLKEMFTWVRRDSLDGKRWILFYFLKLLLIPSTWVALFKIMSDRRKRNTHRQILS